jgi:predicted glycosyltransferase
MGGGVKMKLIIDIGHPAHVHFFKNVVWNLEKRGSKVKIAARDKEVTLDLLEKYGLDYEISGGFRKNLFSKLADIPRRDLKLYNMARKFGADVFIGMCNPYVAHAAKLARKPSITFTDTEFVKLAGMLTYPFTNTICTPACFREKLDVKKHVKFNGYKEIAYLHPKYFKPEPSVLEDIGLSTKDKIIVLRFISWGAAHDVSLKGIPYGSEADLVKALEKYGKVLITSERSLGKDLDKYRIKVSPDKIHSLLYYSSLYMGEGGTMAVEAAVLGTPAIHIESNAEGKATGEISGNFLELRDKYDLLYMYPDSKSALKKATQILENKNSKKEWNRKREKLLKEKIDVTAWMTDFIENYPNSFNKYLEAA